jgi:predicted nucleic-acid-binding protein
LNVTVDTNILVRAAVRDNAHQARLADEILRKATVVVVCLPSLCEFVWVLGKRYKFNPAAIAQAVEWLCDAPNVSTDRPAVDAGLAVLRSGGDFADGVIAYEGAWLGGETFVSFDRIAVAAVAKGGQKARLLR